MSLDDRRLEVVKLGEALLNLAWNLECLPGRLTRLQILHRGLPLNIAHTVVDELPLLRFFLLLLRVHLAGSSCSNRLI